MKTSALKCRAWMSRAALRAPAAQQHGAARAATCAALLSACVLSACAVGPDFQRPLAPTAQGYTSAPLVETATAAGVAGGEAQRFAPGREIAFAWWKDFGSPKLDALVERALRANPTITAAQAALRQANELTAAQRGYYYPSVGADYNVNRQELAGNMGGNSPGIQGNGSTIQTFQNPGGPAPYNGGVDFTMHTAQLTVGFVPDVFGSNRRQVESLQAQEDMTRFQMEAAYITLADNVVAAAIQSAALRAQVEATRQFIAHNAKALEILRKQFELGYAMRLDVAAQELALAQAQQQLPPLQKQLDQTRDLLRALAGELPDADVDTDFDFAALKLPAELPITLPSKLVEQRPDVRAAEEQLHAASAQVGVAIAARLPQFTISGAAGGVASKFTQMFQTGGPFWNIAGDVSVPVFDGFTLLHRERAARAALVQAQEQYRGTVITAFQNVADTLHAIAADADSLAAGVQAAEAAKVALQVTQRQYDSGYVSYLVLLSAQEAYQQAVVTLVQAQANRFADTAALFQALGGGWWNRTDLAQK